MTREYSVDGHWSDCEVENVIMDVLCTCLHRNLLQDDAFVDEIRVSIRYAAAVLVRRTHKVREHSSLWDIDPVVGVH